MKINEASLKKIIFQNYGLSADEMIPLSGFYDKNYKLLCGKQKYFLKIYGFDKLPAIRFQIDLIQKCIKAGLPVAKIIPTIKNKLFFPAFSHQGVLQEFLPAKQLRSVKLGVARLERVGELLGRFHRITHKNTFLGAKWKKYAWDLSQFEIVVRDYRVAKKYLDQNVRGLIEEVLIKWKKNGVGLKNLRKGICHNDYHSGNILITAQGQLAITDFGDAMETWYAADVAIALAHLCFESKKQSTPNFHMKALLKGYSTQFKLTKWEKDCLPLLIQMRAVTIIVETFVRLKKENQHEMYTAMVATKKRVLEFFQSGRI